MKGDATVTVSRDGEYTEYAVRFRVSPEVRLEDFHRAVMEGLREMVTSVKPYLRNEPGGERRDAD